MREATLSNERLLVALKAADTLKRQSDEASALLDTEAADAQTERALRELLALEGGQVDDATIAQAVAMSRTPAPLPFTTMPSGVGRGMAMLYIRRDRWLGKVLGGLAALGLAGTLWWTGDAVLQARFERQAQVAFATLQQQATRLEQAGLTVTKMAPWPRLQAQAQALLAKATEISARAGTTLSGRAPEDDGTLGQAQVAGRQIGKALQDIEELAGDAQRLTLLKQQMAGFQARNGGAVQWPELQAAMVQQRELFAQGLAQENVDTAGRAMAALGHMATAETDRAGLLAAAAGLPAALADEGRALVSKGEAALLAGQTQAAAGAAQDLRSLKALVATSYRMRIVNEPGVKSGVWRYPNDNPSGRNYYIVVDALDAQGNAVVVPIRNEETGRIEQVSRFAVRVPESFYEQVKADKTDNGLIDDDAVGAKAAGVLEPTFSVPVAGGFITSW